MSLKKNMSNLSKYMDKLQICGYMSSDHDSKNNMDVFIVEKISCRGKPVNQKFITNLALEEGYRKVKFVDK